MKDSKIVEYKGKKYAVCRFVKQDGTQRLFVIDEEDLDRMLEKSRTWFNVNGYMGFAEMIKLESNSHYLHNLIMNKPTGGGKGQSITVDHINRIKTDNRKANLRVVTASKQNMNKAGKKRTRILPDNCDITIDEIPKGVYYCARPGRGEQFIADIRHQHGRIMKRSSSSTKIPLRWKLIEIKATLFKLADEYPEIMDDRNIIVNYTDEQIKLMKEYNEIIKLSGYKCSNDNLFKIPKQKTLNVDFSEVSEEFKQSCLDRDITKNSGKTHGAVLPKECGVTELPTYCYFRAEKGNRGDCFVIDSHPGLPESGSRTWSTSGSKAVSIKEKYKQLQTKLIELEKNKPKNGSKSLSHRSKSKSRSNTKTSGSKSTGKKTKPTSSSRTKTNGKKKKINGMDVYEI